jgi:catechol 2,3-dioxygenase-like lactoylglutathione lyase family enzyme
MLLSAVQKVDYVILLCDDLARMRAFYQELFAFPVVAERDDVLALNAGSVTFCLRKRTRHYDGTGRGTNSPGVQLAFQVGRGEVDACHAELVARQIDIAEPPTDQFWGHRTVFFRDPEGNLLELYELRD